MPDETSADRPHEHPQTGPAREPLRQLTLGLSRTSPDLPKSRTDPETRACDEDRELESLAARCLAKAEGARWAAERQRRIRERSESPDDDAPRDTAILEWAERLTDAFCWASTDEASSTPDISLLDQVGGCFETVAEGLLLV